MKRYFGFIDETGVLSHDLDQRFFGIGLLKCEDTTALYERMHILKTKVEAILDLERKQKGIGNKAKSFEFKFANITKGTGNSYLELIDTFLKFQEMKLSCFVIDKDNVPVDIFQNSWEAYIEYSKRLIALNVVGGEKICIIADYMGRPKLSEKFYEPEMRMLPQVYNATVLESHASLYIQLVDVLLGCVVFDFKRQRQPERRFDAVKSSVCNHLMKKIGMEDLARDFESNMLNVFELKT